MGAPGTFLSWLTEAAAGVVQSLSDPKYWGVILAILILVILYSIVSSLHRLNKRLSSAFSELSAIRASLKKIESSLRRSDAKPDPGPGDGEGKDIRDLLFRVNDDRPT